MNQDTEKKQIKQDTNQHSQKPNKTISESIYTKNQMKQDMIQDTQKVSKTRYKLWLKNPNETGYEYK